ncbi:hypothetical protein [Pyruvatibacter sp.]
MDKAKLLSGTSDLVINSPDDIGITFNQHIPDAHLAALRSERMASKDNRKDYQRVASVPTEVVHKWKREGFDIFKEDAKAIIARLQKEDLTAFITTNKQV